MKHTMIAGWILIVICCCGVVVAEEATFRSGQWVEAAEAGGDSPDGKLAEIRQLLTDEEPKAALGKAEQFLADFSDHPGGEEAMNLAGQAQLSRRRWWDAYQWFEKQLTRYPTGPLYERALTREATIGEAFLSGQKRRYAYIFRFDATDDGIEILEQVAERLPGSALAERSLMRVGDFLYQQQRWDEAAMAYTRYGELMRGRYRSAEAEIKAARATYRQFHGIAWDDTPLLEARQLYRSHLARYSRGDTAAEATRAISEIEQAMAQKDYETGSFYERIDRPAAAAFYYGQVTTLYRGSTWATQAADALSRMRADEDPNE